MNDKCNFSKLPQLRLIVTSRCGRACFYCRPSGEAASSSTEDILDPLLAKILTKTFIKQGGSFVKITGGEPAFWSPLVDFVYHLKHDIGVPQVHVISRHPLIGKLATQLAPAGLDLINISLDTLRPDLHYEITGKNDLKDMVLAIRKCVDSGIPVKINTVAMAGVNEGEIGDIIDFCERAGVRSLKLLDTIVDLNLGIKGNQSRLLHLRNKKLNDLYFPLNTIISSLRESAIKTCTLGQGDLGHPMLSITLSSSLEVIVKDHNAGAWHSSICQKCTHFPCHDALMALRLTADGRLQFCLLREDNDIDIKSHLEAGEESITKILRRVLEIYNEAIFYPKMEDCQRCHVQ